MSRKGDWDVQDQCQEDVGGNLHPANGVDHGIAGLAPEIGGKLAEDVVTVDGELHGLPYPEPTVADGEDEAGKGKAPDEEVDCEWPRRVDGAMKGRMHSEEGVNGVVE